MTNLTKSKKIRNIINKFGKITMKSFKINGNQIVGIKDHSHKMNNDIIVIEKSFNYIVMNKKECMHYYFLFSKHLFETPHHSHHSLFHHQSQTICHSLSHCTSSDLLR